MLIPRKRTIRARAIKSRAGVRLRAVPTGRQRTPHWAPVNRVQTSRRVGEHSRGSLNCELHRNPTPFASPACSNLTACAILHHRPPLPFHLRTQDLGNGPCYLENSLPPAMLARLEHGLRTGFGLNRPWSQRGGVQCYSSGLMRLLDASFILLLLFLRYSAAIRLPFSCYSPAIPLLFPCYSPAIPLLFPCYPPCYSGFVLPALFLPLLFMHHHRNAARYGGRVVGRRLNAYDNTPLDGWLIALGAVADPELDHPPHPCRDHHFAESLLRSVRPSPLRPSPLSSHRPPASTDDHPGQDGEPRVVVWLKRP